MADNDDDPFGDEESFDDFDRLTERLMQVLSEFAEDEGIGDELMPALLFRASLTTRMMTYAMSVAKPSGAGLKLDLDRFRRDIDDIIRETKKDADRTVASMKETIAAAAEQDEIEDEP